MSIETSVLAFLSIIAVCVVLLWRRALFEPESLERRISNSSLAFLVPFGVVACFYALVERMLQVGMAPEMQSLRELEAAIAHLRNFYIENLRLTYSAQVIVVGVLASLFANLRFGGFWDRTGCSTALMRLVTTLSCSWRVGPFP